MKRPSFFIPSGEVSMTAFRARLGEYLFAVEKGRQSFVLVRKGKQLARLVPMDDIDIILFDGTVLGEPPLTSCLAAEEAAARKEPKVNP